MFMHSNIESGIAAIESSIREAERYCHQYYREHHDDGDAVSFKYYVERAFVELLVLTDRAQLGSIHRIVASAFKKAQEDGLGRTESYEGEIYLYWTGRIRLFADAIAATHGLAKTTISELQDLKSVLRRAVYVICDSDLFPTPPHNEAAVHNRLEGILKCHYPDLKTKPALTKPIKNFVPDTGIPSAKTLIEYKFITDKTQAKKAAEEILADASGYRSVEWKNILFVIYETHRVLPEEEWRSLLKDCQLFDGYDAIVLSGVPRAA